jgi:hypothetical protein
MVTSSRDAGQRALAAALYMLNACLAIRRSNEGVLLDVPTPIRRGVLRSSPAPAWRGPFDIGGRRHQRDIQPLSRSFSANTPPR